MSLPRRLLLLLASTVALAGAEPAKPKAEKAPKPTKSYPAQPWGDWVEADFPFFSSVLDARRDGGGDRLCPCQ